MKLQNPLHLFQTATESVCFYSVPVLYRTPLFPTATESVPECVQSVLFLFQFPFLLYATRRLAKLAGKSTVDTLGICVVYLIAIAAVLARFFCLRRAIFTFICHQNSNVLHNTDVKRLFTVWFS